MYVTPKRAFPLRVVIADNGKALFTIELEGEKSSDEVYIDKKNVQLVAKIECDNNSSTECSAEDINDVTWKQEHMVNGQPQNMNIKDNNLQDNGPGDYVITATYTVTKDTIIENTKKIHIKTLGKVKIQAPPSSYQGKKVVVNAGENIQLTAKGYIQTKFVKLGKDFYADAKWTTNNPKIATIGERNGVLKPVKTGNIRVTMHKGKNYHDELSIKIIPVKPAQLKGIFFLPPEEKNVLYITQGITTPVKVKAKLQNDHYLNDIRNIIEKNHLQSIC